MAPPSGKSAPTAPAPDGPLDPDQERAIAHAQCNIPENDAWNRGVVDDGRAARLNAPALTGVIRRGLFTAAAALSVLHLIGSDASAEAIPETRWWSATLAGTASNGFDNGIERLLWPGVSGTLQARVGGVHVGLEGGAIDAGRRAGSYPWPGRVPGDYDHASVRHVGLCVRTGARAGTEVPYFIAGLASYLFKDDYESGRQRILDGMGISAIGTFAIAASLQ